MHACREQHTLWYYCTNSHMPKAAGPVTGLCSPCLPGAAQARLPHTCNPHTRRPAGSAAAVGRAAARWPWPSFGQRHMHMYVYRAGARSPGSSSVLINTHEQAALPGCRRAPLGRRWPARHAMRPHTRPRMPCQAPASYMDHLCIHDLSQCKLHMWDNHAKQNGSSSKGETLVGEGVRAHQVATYHTAVLACVCSTAPPGPARAGGAGQMADVANWRHQGCMNHPSHKAVDVSLRALKRCSMGRKYTYEHAVRHGRKGNGGAANARKGRTAERSAGTAVRQPRQTHGRPHGTPSGCSSNATLVRRQQRQSIRGRRCTRVHASGVAWASFLRARARQAGRVRGALVRTAAWTGVAAPRAGARPEQKEIQGWRCRGAKPG
jgi:hypothetical protein